jgi:polyribonucleotide nucleotidyltransferase
MNAMYGMGGMGVSDNGMSGMGMGGMGMGGMGMGMGGMGMGGMGMGGMGMGGMGMGGMGGMGMGGNGMGMGMAQGLPENSGGGMTTITLEIDDAAAGNVIGKRGSTVTQLQAVSGARIQISKKGAAPNVGSDKRQVTITGDAVRVEYAKVLVLEKAQQAQVQQAMAGGNHPGAMSGLSHDGTMTANAVNGMMSGRSQNIPTSTRTLTIPDAAAGNVIGKGGSTIMQMQQMSGASIQVAKKNESGERQVSIAGPVEAVQMAQMMVMNKLQEAARKELGGGM